MTCIYHCWGASSTLPFLLKAWGSWPLSTFLYHTYLQLLKNMMLARGHRHPEHQSAFSNPSRGYAVALAVVCLLFCRVPNLVNLFRNCGLELMANSSRYFPVYPKYPSPSPHIPTAPRTLNLTPPPSILPSPPLYTKLDSCGVFVCCSFLWRIAVNSCWIPVGSCGFSVLDSCGVFLFVFFY